MISQATGQHLRPFDAADSKDSDAEVRAPTLRGVVPSRPFTSLQGLATRGPPADRPCYVALHQTAGETGPGNGCPGTR